MMRPRSIVFFLAGLFVVLGGFPHVAVASDVPVTITVAGIRYVGAGKLQFGGRYLDGHAMRADRVFYFDASLRDGMWTIHVSTSPKPGGYPSCWAEGTGQESVGKIAVTLSANWLCAGGATAIEIDLPNTP